VPAVGLVCEHVCFRGGGAGAAAGHHALSMSVNSRGWKEIYDRLLHAPGIKHNAELRYAGPNTCFFSCLVRSASSPPTHSFSLVTSLSTLFVS